MLWFRTAWLVNYGDFYHCLSHKLRPAQCLLPNAGREDKSEQKGITFTPTRWQQLVILLRANCACGLLTDR